MARCTLGSTLVVIGFGLMFLHGRSAFAEAPRLLLLDPPPELVEAASAALSTWSVEPIHAPAPDASAGRLAVQARSLAKARGADAVAWLYTEPATGAVTLYVYRVDRAHLASRALTLRPPYSDASAVSVALTLETLLDERGSPRQERRPAPVVEPRAPIAPQLGVAATLSSEAYSSGFRTARLTLAGEWRPFSLPYTVAGEISLGPAHTFAYRLRPAELSDLSLGLSVRRGQVLPWRAVFLGHLGVAVHRSHLRVPGGSGQSDAFARTDWNPGFSAGGRVRRPIGWRLSAEVQLSLHYFTHTQTYYDPSGDSVIHTPRASLQAGIGLHMVLGSRP